MILYTAGASLGADINVSTGYTFRVDVNDVEIYSFGEVVYRGIGYFGGSSYGEALKYVAGYHGPAVISWSFSDGGRIYTVKQTFLQARSGANHRSCALADDGIGRSAAHARTGSALPRR